MRFEYALLDSGNHRKLERFGQYVLDRPEPKAIWSPKHTVDEWRKADAVFAEKTRTEGLWERRAQVPQEWQLQFDELTFSLRLTPFKHVGLFPEQAEQWRWMSEVVRRANRPVKVLNLFAYTGAATLAGAAAGAAITHVEASRSTLSWARHNAELSGLAAAPIRWIPEDALTFLNRLVKRGETYDGIILDPPLTGIGPHGQRWQFSKNIDETLELCRKILSPTPLFLLLNDYAVEYPPSYWRGEFARLGQGLEGSVEAGRLKLESESGAPSLETGTWVSWKVLS